MVPSGNSGSEVERRKKHRKEKKVPTLGQALNSLSACYLRKGLGVDKACNERLRADSCKQPIRARLHANLQKALPYLSSLSVAMC